jgi:hypothetical protein
LKLKEECDELIGKVMDLISQEWKGLSKKRAEKCCSICAAYLSADGHRPIDFQEGDSNASIIGYSPNVRISCSSAVTKFSNRNDLAEIPQLIDNYLVDNDNHVRANIARALPYYYRNNQDKFWEVVTYRLKNEVSEYGMVCLLSNIHHYSIIKTYPDRVSKLTSEIFQVVIEKGQRSQVLQYYVDIIIACIENSNSETCKDIITKGYVVHGFISAVISKFTNKLSPDKNGGLESLSIEFADYARNELKNIIDAQIKRIKNTYLSDQSINENFKVIDYIVQRMFFSIPDRKTKLAIGAESIALYNYYKPVILHVVMESKELHGGFIIGHTGYYFAQLLEMFIEVDAENILMMFSEMVSMSSKSGFANDKTTLDIIVRVAEIYLIDYKTIILKPENFNYLLQMLNFFAESGWQEALELIWRLNEAF